MNNNPMIDPNDACNNPATTPPHDCYAWNQQHYRLTPDYMCTECGMCGHITGFMWRSWWRRVRSLWTSEPVMTRVK